MYAENMTTTSRDGAITLTSVGGTGASVTEKVSFTQAGSQGIEVGTVPRVVSNLPTALGSIDVNVRLLGSATGWSASEALDNPVNFLNLGGTTSGIAGSACIDDRLIRKTRVRIYERAL